MRTGQRALVEGWGGDGALEGIVRRVEPYGFTKVSALGIEEQRVKVIIDITGLRNTGTRSVTATVSSLGSCCGSRRTY